MKYIVECGFEDDIYLLYSLEERLVFFKEKETDIIDDIEYFRDLFSYEEALKLYNEGHVFAYVFLSQEDKLDNLDVFSNEDFDYKLLNCCNFYKEAEEFIFKVVDRYNFIKNWDDLCALYNSLDKRLTYEEFIDYYNKFSFSSAQLCEILQVVDYYNLQKVLNYLFYESDLLKNGKQIFLGAVFMEEYKKLNDHKKRIILKSLMKSRWSKSITSSDFYHFLSIINPYDRWYIFTMMIEDGLIDWNDEMVLWEYLQLIGDSHIEDLIKKYSYLAKKKESAVISLCISRVGSVELKKYMFENYVMNRNDAFVSDVLSNLVSSDGDTITILSIINLCLDKKNLINLDDNDIFNAFVNMNHELVSPYDFPCLIDYCINKYNIRNTVNFNKMVLFFGSCVFSYLDNQSVVDIINLSEEDFDKCLRLFDGDNLVLDDDAFNTIISSVLNRKFRLEKSSVYEAFSRFEYFINDKDRVNVMFLLGDIFNRDKEKLDEFLMRYNISDADEFVDGLMNKDGKCLNILHEMTNAYIARSKEDYVKDNHQKVLDKVNYEKRYEKNFCIKHYLKNCDVWDIFFDISKSAYEQEALLYFGDYELLWKVISLKKALMENKSDLSKEDHKLSRYLKNLDLLLEGMWSEGFFDSFILDVKDKRNARYELSFKEVDNRNILSVISKVNVDNFKSNFLDNEELYDVFVNDYVRKYKIFSWEDTFDRIFADADLEYSYHDKGMSLNYFYRIYPSVKGKSLTSFIDYSNVYNSSSKKYTILLGKENFETFVVNAKPNQSSWNKEKRISMIEEYVKKMYLRRSCTVPCIDEEISLSNGKELKVNIGDFRNPLNLIYGELTGSCMRVGGSFEGLFKFCIENENGFHIRFEDPDTGEFVSRVSGIRNGNTLFLNELRNSVSDKYVNSDVVEALEYVAHELIAMTSDQKNKIENVLITTDYAMSGYDTRDYEIDIEDIEDGFYGIPFNFSNDNICVLASVYDDDLEFSFDSEDICEYPVLNDIKFFDINEDKSKEVENDLVRIHVVDMLLGGIKLEDIDINCIIDKVSSFNIVSGIYGKDFYVCKDIDGNVYKYVMKNVYDSDDIYSKVNGILEHSKSKKIKKV